MDEYRRGGRRVDGVFVQGSDIPHIVAQLAEHIGAPHMPVESARSAVDKYEMKLRFAQAGVPLPWFAPVHSEADLQSHIRSRGLPLILKPVDRSGSRGVFCLTTASEASFLYEQSVAASFSGRVMVEEYIRGPQISTESVVYRGAVFTPGFVDRNYEHFKRFAPHVIENGGWAPSVMSDEVRAEVDLIIEKAARALDVTDGIVKGDVVVGPQGAKLIEMAARASGGDFSESLILRGTGVNIIEAGVNIAVGRAPDLEALQPRCQRAIANRYFFPDAGVLAAILGTDEVRAQPWVKKLEFWYKPGDTVPKVRSHADRFGVFVVEADDRNELERRIAWVYERIHIDVRSGAHA
jgi:biotin carboxylase